MADDKTLDGRLTLTVEEAGRALGCARGTAYRMCRLGVWPTIRIGKKIVVPRASIDRLIAAAEARADAAKTEAETAAKYS